MKPPPRKAAKRTPKARPKARRLLLRTRRDTRRLGGAIAHVVGPGDLVVLAGDLGAGKTFLVSALARAAGVRERVTSPSFVLAQEYETPRGSIVHADLYRLREGSRPLGDEVDALGLRERRLEGAVVVVEWGQEAIDQLGGEPALVVRLTLSGARERVAELSGSKASEVRF